MFYNILVYEEEEVEGEGEREREEGEGGVEDGGGEKSILSHVTLLQILNEYVV